MSMDFVIDRSSGDRPSSRLFRRVCVNLPATLQKTTEPPVVVQRHDTYSGVIRNMSIQGIVLEAKKKFPVRSLVQVDLEDENYSGPPFTGRVCWIKPKTKPKSDSAIDLGDSRPTNLFRIGIEFDVDEPNYWEFANKILSSRLVLDKGDAYFDAPEYKIQTPEDLYWDYHVNISKGRLIVPTSQRLNVGDPIKLQIKILSNMDIIRVAGTVMHWSRNQIDPTAPFFVVLNLDTIEKGDKRRLYQYIRNINLKIGAPSLSTMGAIERDSSQKPSQVEIISPTPPLDSYRFNQKSFSSGRGFYLFGQKELPLMFVDLPSFRQSNELNFYSNGTKSNRLLTLKKDRAVYRQYSEFTLLSRQARELARFRFTFASDPSSYTVEIFDESENVLLSLVESSTVEGKGAIDGQRTYLFVVGDRTFGKLILEDSGSFHIQLGGDDWSPVDSRFLIVAAIILGTRLI
jgi:Tfp pilus assembly protein PilZ